MSDRHFHKRLEVVSEGGHSDRSPLLERTVYRCRCGHEWPIDDPKGQEPRL